VASIRTAEGRVQGVTLQSGEALDAALVVSNADAVNTYEKLLDRPRKRWTKQKVSRARSSMGLFVWYFGVEGNYDDVPHHLILMGPRYRGLLKDIFKRKVLADDFSLYLHRPTATDPSLAPPGCETFYVLSPVPNLDGDVDWTTMAEPYRERIAEALEKTVLPGLRAGLRTSRMMTPLDFRDRLDSFRGAGFSLEPILLQSAWFRPNNRSEEVEGLFLVGAGTHPGAGLPGVLSTAKVLEHLIPDAPRAA
jgi:phytoene desaturase